MMHTQFPDRTKAPVTGKFSPRSLPEPDTRTLSNGIIRHSLTSDDYKLVKLSIICPTGAMEYKPTVAHLRGRMLKEGSRGYTRENIAECFDFNGASMVSQPSNHHSITSITALRRNIHEVLPVFFDLLLNPVFPEKELSVLKRQLITELQCNLETPGFHASNHTRAIMSGHGHRYGLCETIGGIEGIVSADLVECQNSSINAKGMYAYMSGNADSELINLIDSYLENIPSGGPGLNPQVLPFIPEKPQVKKIQVDASLQNAVVVSIPVPGYGSPDYWALKLAVYALGGYFGSRLMQNIREDKGYTYGIGANLSCFSEGAFVSISCECDPSYTEGVITEIKNELVRFANQPMDNAELGKVQLSVASKLAGVCDTPMKVQSQLISQQINSLAPTFYNDFWNAVATVTPQQMSEAVHKYMSDDQFRVIIAGDFKK